ncbi:hypothetical protein LEN26_001812 [Aphanomyces euteiches]|nr:hypothetical protein AeMF1_003828 [Aphanomyces euteiches]KAH9160543.1 hypothetical protein LEN26_001812 [Aphanomyces euteiches]KAH9183779.1 hypothetical protein AeNC1_014245 [Aphanomyces euteiches]
MKCFFNDCENPTANGTWKCTFHRHRSLCLVHNCQNQVYARNLCVKHGGKPKCQAENCTMNSRVGNFCSRHGASHLKKRCSRDGCDKQAHARGFCVRHGGGRKCRIDDCTCHARNGPYCARHNREIEDKMQKEPVQRPLHVEPLRLPSLHAQLAKPDEQPALPRFPTPLKMLMSVIN